MPVGLLTKCDIAGAYQLLASGTIVLPQLDRPRDENQDVEPINKTLTAAGGSPVALLATSARLVTKRPRVAAPQKDSRFAREL